MCKQAKNEGCKTPSECVSAAAELLDFLPPKWDPREPANPTTIDEWATIQDEQDEEEAPRIFRPSSLLRYLKDGFRVLTQGEAPATHPVTRGSEPESPTRTEVYTDGSCINNGSEDATAGSGVWYGEDDPRNLACHLSSKHNTNNAGEIVAVLLVAQTNEDNTELNICSDSAYTIDALTVNLEKFESNGWIGVSNKTLLQATVGRLRQQSAKTLFSKVKGHSGLKGNDGADAKANEGANKEFVSLINLTTPAHLRTPGLKLSTATQSLLYRAILSDKTRKQRRQTDLMVERVKIYVNEWTGNFPSNTLLWQSV